LLTNKLYLLELIAALWSEFVVYSSTCSM